MSEKRMDRAWNMIAIPMEEAAKEVYMRWAREDAIEECEHKKALDIAKKMLARGMEPDVVADLADLHIDEVEALKRGE